ncbi:MAG: hypothetical protein ACLTZA_05025 [Anaerostipes sp.]
MSIRLLRVVILSFLIPVVFVLLFRVYDDNVTFSIDYPLPEEKEELQDLIDDLD